MLRYFPHAIYEVARHDDKYFYVKQFLPTELAVVPPVKLPDSIKLPETNHLQWRPFDRGLPRVGQWRDNFAVADVNGDGKADLIFPPARKTLGAPAVFLGDGQGGWRRWANASFPPVAFDYGGVAVADFNGDGHADIAVGLHLLGLTAVTGNSKGEFNDFSEGLPRRTREQRPTLTSRKVLTLDWDGDGKPDIIALNERFGATDPVRAVRDGVAVYLNRDGKWLLAPSEKPLAHAGLVAADVASQRLVVVDLGAPGGTLIINERVAGVWRSHDVPGFADNVRFTALAMSGAADGSSSAFAVAYRARSDAGWWSYVDVISRENGSWKRIGLHASKGASETRGLTFARLRQGKADDVIALAGDGLISVYRQSGTSTYTKDQGMQVPGWRAGCEGYALQASDLDGDGVDELVAAYAGESSAHSVLPECTSGGGIEVFKLDAAP